MIYRRAFRLVATTTTVLFSTFLFAGRADAYSFGSGVQIFTPPSSIAADCSADVTQPLYDWIYSLPQGTQSSPTEVQFASGACYQIDGMLFLRGLTDFIFNGNGAIFQQTSVVLGDTPNDPPPNRYAYCGSTNFKSASGTKPTGIDIMWFIEGGCDLVFENFTIEGNNVFANPGGTQEQDSAFQLSGVQRALLTNDVVEAVWGDFVTVAGLHEAPSGGVSYPSTDVTISNNNFDASGRQGVAVVYGKRIAITGNTIKFSADSAIDLEADSTGGKEADILVDSNTFHGYSYLLAAFTGAALSDLAFTNNSVTDTKIVIKPTSLVANNIAINGNIAGFTTDWSNDYDILFGQVQTAQVSGNHAPLAPPTNVFVQAGKNAAGVTVQDNALDPGPGAPTNFEATPLTANSPSQGTECDNSSSAGVPLDTNANPPSLDQCSSVVPVPPTPPSLPLYASS
jgi:hypothetical protein